MSYYYTSSNSSTAAIDVDVSKDVQLASPPEDSISAMSWSSAANLLAVSSWDSKLRVYNFVNNPKGEPHAIMDFDKPVLSCHWSPDGKQVVGAGTDQTARVLDLGSNGGPARQVAAHDLSISSVRFFQGPSISPMVVTGSWDKTIKYWDLRSPNPVATVKIGEKVNSIDVQKDLLMVATGEKGYHAINLQNPTVVFEKPTLDLRWNAKTIRCFPDGKGFVAGGMEGRCSVFWLPAAGTTAGTATGAATGNATGTGTKQGFSFKCHRSPPNKNVVDCYTVNAISFHPTHGTFCTGGSDGTINIWDKDSKTRSSYLTNLGGPVSATAFSDDGNLLAYAVSYDWSKGFAHNTPETVNKIMIHSVKEQEVKGRASKR